MTESACMAKKSKRTTIPSPENPAFENPGSQNSVRLLGRVSVEPETRKLPSGDELVSFRLIVRRPASRPDGGAGERTKVDVIDIACWSAATRRAARALRPDTHVQVDGALRRRFFKTGGGAASRYEVEATSVRRT